MSKTKWFKRIAPNMYEPTVRCMNCSDYVFPAPRVWGNWALDPEGVWLHVSTLEAECRTLPKVATPNLGVAA